MNVIFPGNTSGKGVQENNGSDSIQLTIRKNVLNKRCIDLLHVLKCEKKRKKEKKRKRI